VTPLTDPFKRGVRFGANCLGTSWVAMSLLVVVGLMQLESMAAICAALLIERHAQRRSVTVLFSLAVLAYGIAIAFHPGLVPTLPAHHVAPMGTMK
jgi:predicted metal-binding membrane protein